MKVSLLLPTLGEREEEISRLMKSLVSQSYKNFEVIVVSQDNYDKVDKIIERYNELDIKHVKMKDKGLSKARNIGVLESKGEIVVLSDDDCWYPLDALENIVGAFQNKEVDILLTKIYDKAKGIDYKNYNEEDKFISTKYELMSRSSIEIAINRTKISKWFDERFGLGSKFCCGEEVDFLLENLKTNKKIYYMSCVTVFHSKKNNKNSNQIIAKGALYAKHYSWIISFVILGRDLMKKKEFNFINFYKGYFEYKR